MAAEARPDTRGWTIGQWRAAYRDGRWTPAQLLDGVRAIQYAEDPAWISRLGEAAFADQLAGLARRLADVGGDLARLPLYGVPFAVKDNIDAAGWDTTAACPAFAHAADGDATVVARLRAAGAILMGKTNLDQFATGLVGTRSPYGAVPNTFDPDYVSGGSSSGSASVTARGIVPFALGTDTAGSGRVPAGFNNLVGLKPTPGWLSTSGVVPACRTLDCVSVFALTVDDAWEVAALAGGYDAADPYSRAQPGSASRAPSGADAASSSLRLAVPDAPEFFGDARAEQAFEQALAKWQSLGARIVPVDYTPFRALAELLYQGPWVAERFVAVQSLWERAAQDMDPVVRGIVEQAAKYSAADAFRGEYARARLARQVQDTLAGFDAMLVPTSPSIYTIAELREDPVGLNSRFGYYTNFVNFAGLSALALPATIRDDGLPAGITLIGPAWDDAKLAALGRRWQAAVALPLGATGLPPPSASGKTAEPETGPAGAVQSPAAPANQSARESDSDADILLAVVGAHLRGMPLNHQLTSRGACFVAQTHSAPEYRLYALANTGIPKPGLCRVPAGGAGIVLELWSLSASAFGAFTAEVPAPLGIGTVRLADGREVKGFICEPAGLRDAQDITVFGGWRAYLDGEARDTSSQESRHV